MTETAASLRRRMEEAAARLDFEEAKRLRDRLNLLRLGTAPEAAAVADTAGLLRQQPGNMGIGSSQPRPVRPADWVAPAKPDPMTRGRGSTKGKSG